MFSREYTPERISELKENDPQIAFYYPAHKVQKGAGNTMWLEYHNESELFSVNDKFDHYTGSVH